MAMIIACNRTTNTNSGFQILFILFKFNTKCSIFNVIRPIIIYYKPHQSSKYLKTAILRTLLVAVSKIKEPQKIKQQFFN